LSGCFFKLQKISRHYIFNTRTSVTLVYKGYAAIVPTGVEVQEGNYAVLNPKPVEKIPVQEILEFGQNYLNWHLFILV